MKANFIEENELSFEFTLIVHVFIKQIIPKPFTILMSHSNDL